MRLTLSLLGAVLLGLGVACSSGDQGPPGSPGPPGPQGSDGGAGSSCTQSGGLSTAVAVSSPTNGSFFVTGERPVVTITFTDGCGNTVQPSSLGSTADFFVVGPRAPLQTVTAYDLLNFHPSGPFSAQTLKLLADGGVPNANMTIEADGTVVYTLNPITSEASGTYSASVWAIATDPIDQTFVLQDFQIGTSTVEGYASGTVDDSSCASCHRNQAPDGRIYMAHSPASTFAPKGFWSLDQLPIGGCKACHNNAGYSPNHLLRKTHGVHRGEHLADAGVAHPEYGYGQDTSLAAFTNVGFPLMPTGGTAGVALPASVAMEKSCTSCHVTDTWKTNPSRAACGTCHDNVYFEGALLSDGGVDPNASSGVIVLGKPGGSDCTNDASCSSLNANATCNSTTKNCELTHPKQTEDKQCVTCHAPTNGVGGPPIVNAHAISPYNPPISLDGYALKNVKVTGGSGPDGSFQVNDTLTLKFQLFDNQSTPASVTDLASNGAWAGTFLVAGPTSNPQRVFGTAVGLGTSGGGLNMKTASQGTLTYDPPSQTYTYVPAGGWPGNSLAPVNHPAAGTPTNPPGNYTVWFYWAKTTSGVLDAVDAQVAVAFGVNQKASGRQVVTQAACGACHGMTDSGFPHLALHGGQRKNGETCSTCHTQNAFDRVVGSRGVACTSNAQCSGYPTWESCQDVNLDGTLDTCVVTVDPTPNVTVDYQQLVHNIHFARLREGYAERDNRGSPDGGIAPKTLNYLGFQNSLLDFQEILLPLDVRACTNCHQSTSAACSDSSPCGYGQTCQSGKCVNTAWQNPTTRACITCHDSATAAAHAAQNTTSSGTESCDVCHGTGGIVPVAEAHNITNPYVPPYAREK